MNFTLLKILLLAASLAVANFTFAESDGHDHAEQHDTEDQEDHDEHAKEGHERESDGHNSEGSESDHEEHTGHDEDGHEEEQLVKLTAQQIEVAGIVSEPLRLQHVSDVIHAPGEVVLNAYRTTSVTPRVSAQVVERHAKLGDDVTVNQPLLTLSSVEMANAQGELLVSDREWKRVKKLGRKVVSASRFTEARVAHEQAKARVRAYGMTTSQITAFVKSGDATKANGSFQLLAPQAGTVIKDDFILGELIKPGRELFVISDESVLWVEAKLTPSQVKQVSPGNSVTIKAESKLFPGQVVQVHHALDEDTRTLGVRIAFANPDDALHPGVFVQAKISSNNNAQAIAVPVNAVLRNPDGDWMVFTEHEAGEFKPKEVELIRTTGEISIIEGLKPGTHVVVKGAFFVQSELAKSGFEIHNH